MSDRLIEELKAENLCTHYILPLLRLNKFSFTSSNFLNSYICIRSRGYESYPHFSSECFIVVQVMNQAYCSRRVFGTSSYCYTLKDETHHYIAYRLPGAWWDDITKFLTGSYAAMSVEAINLIITWSNLPHRVRDINGRVVTDVRLLALEDHRRLREMWIERYGELSDLELFHEPDEGSFIDLNTLTRIEPE